MKVNKEVEFNNIVNDILKNDEFIKLKYEIHHGISRMQHSLSVAKLTYIICKKLHWKNYQETTRAALLHDYFLDCDVYGKKFVNHPVVAMENAKKSFEINDFQANIIASHMFPTCKILPKYKESWLVSVADKVIALKECTRYKVPLTLGAAFLFFINFCIIQR